MDGWEPHDGSLSIEELKVGLRVVIAVSGEIDLASVDELKAALARAADGKPRDVWIDLTRVGFMDSTGLTTLVIAHREFDEPTRRVAVICPEGPVRRLLELAGLDRVLPVYPSRSAAQAAS